MESMRAQFEREADLETPWTSYNPSLARPLLNTRKFLEKGLAKSGVVSPPRPAAAAIVTVEEVPAASESRNGDSTGHDNSNAQTAAEGANESLDGNDGNSENSTSATNKPQGSAFEALQRKFESHKITADRR
jgi:hypothetical protein